MTPVHTRRIDAQGGVQPDVSSGTPIDIVSEHELSTADDASIRDRVGRLCAATPVPATSARVKLDVLDRTSHRTINATATLDLGNRIVRAHETGERLLDVIDTLCLRLRRQVREISDRQADRNHGRFSGHDPAETIRRRQERTRFVDIPAEARTLVRHKTYAPAPSTVEEAEFDRQTLDYDFFLFEEAGTGIDHLLVVGDDDLELRSLDGTIPPDAIGHVDRVSTTPAPGLSVAEALDRLADGHEHVVFFRDLETGRGNVAYRRLDGHYGLITPD